MPINKKKLSWLYVKPGEVAKGTVTRINYKSRTFDVRLDGSGKMVCGCVWASPFVSYLLGFKMSFTPPRGTRVGLVTGNPPMAFTGEGSDLPDAAAIPRTSTGFQGTKPGDFQSNQTGVATAPETRRTHSPAMDLHEGEFEITNMLGVALTMMTTIAKLGAGDRNFIEFGLLNDMTRIVSEQYKHFSAFGDMQIYNDGRLQARFDGTSYPYEAAGRMAATDPLFPVSGNVVQTNQIDAINETGRWRYSHFLGFLGDFIHIFVTDPLTTIGSLAQSGLRSGKGHIHLNNDGTILLQSTAEIVIERVCRIPVPIEAKRFEDPKGVTKASIESLNGQYLKLWNYGSDLTDASKTAYQLREYARWLSQYHCLARFLQYQDKGQEWNIASESQTPAPDWNSGEKDKQQANSGVPGYAGAGTTTQEIYNAYSTQRIMRDGSQVHLDPYGNAWVTGPSGIQMASPLPVLIESAADLSLRSGANIFISARRNVEIVANVGGIRMKARTWFHGLCEWGSVWFKSDAQDPASPNYKAITTSDLSDPVEDPLPIVLPQAILIEGTKGRGLLQTAQQLVVGTSGQPYTSSPTDDSADAILQAQYANVQNRGFKNVTMKSIVGAVALVSQGPFIVKSASALWQLTERLFDIDQAFTWKGMALNVMQLRTNIMSAIDVILGPAFPGPSPGGNLHYNHIAQLPKDLTDFTPAYATSDDIKPLSTVNPETTSDPFSGNGPVWDFDPLSEYTWPKLDIFESLAQQYVRLDLPAATQNSYSIWNAQTGQIKPATRNGQNLPYPGKGVQQYTHTGGEPLSTPSAKAPAEQNSQTALVQQAATFKFRRKTPSTS